MENVSSSWRCRQDVLRQLRKHMSSEMKRLEDFREELSAEGAPQAGAMLCGSHHLEHSLREASGHLLLLETPGVCPAANAVASIRSFFPPCPGTACDWRAFRVEAWLRDEALSSAALPVGLGTQTEFLFGGAEDEAGVAETSMLSLEADAFGAFKQRGALRLSKVVIDSFRQAAGPYFKKSNIQSFAVTHTPDYRY